MPSNFVPGLKEQAPDLKLDGPPVELEFKDFPDISVVVESPFGRQPIVPNLDVGLESQDA